MMPVMLRRANCAAAVRASLTTMEHGRERGPRALRGGDESHAA